MKNIISATAMTTVLVFGSLNTEAKNLITSDMEDNFVRICKALKSDSQMKLKRAIDQSRTTYRKVATGLVCNGQDALAFAISQQAYENARYLAHRAEITDRFQLAMNNKNN